MLHAFPVFEPRIEPLSAINQAAGVLLEAATSLNGEILPKL